MKPPSAYGKHRGVFLRLSAWTQNGRGWKESETLDRRQRGLYQDLQSKTAWLSFDICKYFHPTCEGSISLGNAVEGEDI